MALFVARSNLKCFRQQIVSISPLTTSLRHKLSGKAGAEPVKSVSKSSEPSKPQTEEVIGKYKAPEYYNHNEWSFNDMMIDMEKYWQPQPSSKRPN
ncbi:NADH:ubiquinone oxidoreductase subunit V3 isoform X1 [Tachypleus tridentatus]|uniref:NADH:ubiquinone oxidoreductase subunit V3 isoform X1 n=1 Tax=Tachypleus tridentatus TaxID=6853 RepID=UPI003FCEF4BD